VETWLPDDPYPMALIQELPEAPLASDDRDRVALAERAVRRALAYKAELDEPAAPATIELDDDASTLALQLAAIAPIGPLDRQSLLEEDDPRRRVDRLIEFVDDENTVLAARLAQG